MAGTLHFNLTRRADSWLAGRATGAGFYSATEVYLAQGYVADAVAIASLQHRFWLATGGGGYEPAPDPETRSDVASEFIDQYDITLPAMRIGQHAIPERLVIVFETKISRGDLLSTFSSSKNGNRRTPVGNLHYLIAPNGLNCLDLLPDWWGILRQSGRGLKELRSARFCELDQSRLWHAAFRVLLASHRNPVREVFIQAQINDIST